MLQLDAGRLMEELGVKFPLPPTPKPPPARAEPAALMLVAGILFLGFFAGWMAARTFYGERMAVLNARLSFCTDQPPARPDRATP